MKTRRRRNELTEEEKADEAEARLTGHFIEITPQMIYDEVSDAVSFELPCPVPFGTVIRWTAREYGLSVKGLKRYCPALRRVYDKALRDREEERRAQAQFQARRQP